MTRYKGVRLTPEQDAEISQRHIDSVFFEAELDGRGREVVYAKANAGAAAPSSEDVAEVMRAWVLVNAFEGNRD